MITNKRQLRISKTRLDELGEEIARNSTISTSHAAADVFAAAYVRNLQAEYNRLKGEIEDYEKLASGLFELIPVSSLATLPIGLIKARIARNLSQKNLGELIGIKEQQVQRYESQNYKSASFSRLLEIADALNLRISPSVLLEDQARDNASNAERGEDISIDDIIPLLPIEEMYKRGWFWKFRGTLKEARENADILFRDHFMDVASTGAYALHRKQIRIGAEADSYSLLAWQFQVMHIALQQQVASFDIGVMDAKWFRKLASLSTDLTGPLLAREFLATAGISFVLLPHLPKTYLDGAACSLPSGNPVVGLTLRHDRLDNFWFVLFHELAHVKLHLFSSDSSAFFDDLDFQGNGVEKEADEFAGEALLPSNQWEISVARYIQTAETVKAFAEEEGIHPAIVAGRIRKETGNYVLLNDLIGAGSVRRLFPDIEFAY